MAHTYSDYKKIHKNWDLIESHKEAIAVVEVLKEALEYYAQGGGMTMPTIKPKEDFEASTLITMVMYSATKPAREALAIDPDSLLQGNSNKRKKE